MKLSFRHLVSFFALGMTASAADTPADPAKPLRIGMIGLDTSHVVAFTRLLHDASAEGHVPGGRVVGAYKGGSPDVEASVRLLEGYTRELVTKHGVKLYDRIEDLAREVDAIMIESIDGRPHLDQARRAFAGGKPVFIDKPFAGSLSDAIEIQRLAKQHNVPVFSASSLRYHAATLEAKGAKVGRQIGALAMGPAGIEPHHPDLFWYGIHSVEALYTILGPGCTQVSRVYTADTDIVTGVWPDGRTGIVRGTRNAKTEYLLMVFGATGRAQTAPGGAYAALLVEVMRFFRTGIPPVTPEETLEILAFMEAADESKRRGGAPVLISEVMRAAGAKAATTR